MTLAQIDYLGWIEHKNYKDPDFLTLTWSATIANFQSNGKKMSILIDYGMFQWGRNDEHANQTVDERLLWVDAMILTHAHLDHCGRLPLLVKNGFEKPIYMTDMTKSIIYLMLNDYITIMEENRDKALNEFKKIRTLANKYFYAIEANEKLIQNGLTTEQKDKIYSHLEKKFWEDYNMSEILEEADSFQKEYEIYSKEDLQKKYSQIPIVLYDRYDLEKTMNLIQTLEVWEEVILENSYQIEHFSEDVMKKMFKKVSEWYTQEISMSAEIFNEAVEMIEQRLEDTIAAEAENIVIQEKNKQTLDEKEEFFAELIEAFDFYDANNEPELAPELHHKYSKIIEEYTQNFNIEKRQDLSEHIANFLEPLYDVKYSSEVIKKARKQIIMKIKTWEMKNQDYLKELKLTFIDAGHIEWSVQAIFTAVTEKATSIVWQKSRLAKTFWKKEIRHDNFLFSGDLWRKKDPNITGTPALSPYKLNFLQIETTYGGRNHPNRAEEERKFIEALTYVKWKALTPAFSNQRSQELLIFLLETMEAHLWDIEKLENYKKDLKTLRQKYDTLPEKEWRVAQMYKKQIEGLKQEIHVLKTTSPAFWNIVLDSPLSQRITEKYLEKNYSKYKFLDPQYQQEVFDRQVIEYVTSKEEQEKLYAGKRKDKKEIIVSASGMCTGGSVQYHLEQILENPKAKVVFVWYCPPNSIWWLIKDKKPVFINQKKYDVKCSIADNKGFSGHLDHQEILMYIKDLIDNGKLARNATIVLNHGWEKRELVKADILMNVLNTKKNVDVLIPNLWDSVEIKC